MVNQNPTTEKYINSQEAAKLLHCTPGAIRLYQHRGKLKVAAKEIRIAAWGNIKRKIQKNLYNLDDVLSLAKS